MFLSGYAQNIPEKEQVASRPFVEANKEHGIFFSELLFQDSPLPLRQSLHSLDLIIMWDANLNTKKIDISICPFHKNKGKIIKDIWSLSQEHIHSIFPSI
jgi:hypothetical protein